MSERETTPRHRLKCDICDHVWVVEGEKLDLRCPACPPDRYAQRISVEPANAE